MSFHRPRIGDSTFSGRPFNLRPRTQSPAASHSPMAAAPVDPVTDTHTAEPQPPQPESIAPLPKRPAQSRSPIVSQTRSASQISRTAPSTGSGKTGWPPAPWPCFPVIPVPENRGTGDLNGLGGREIQYFDHLDKTKDLATAY
jgi:hypothetical protein